MSPWNVAVDVRRSLLTLVVVVIAAVPAPAAQARRAAGRRAAGAAAGHVAEDAGKPVPWASARRGRPASERTARSEEGSFRESAEGDPGRAEGGRHERRLRLR